MEVAAYPTGDARILHGVREVVQLPQPAAGADWQFTCVGGYYRRLVVASYHLVTSATVASRFQTLQFTDGNVVLFGTASTYSIAAGLAVDTSFAQDITTNTNNVAGTRSDIAIPDLWLAPGFVVKSATGALQAGDQFSNIVLFFECVERRTLEYLTPRLEIDLMEA